MPIDKDHTILSRRYDDMSAEAQLGRFLDAYLYSRLLETGPFSHIERMRGREEQLAGVDVRIFADGGAVYDVDEKAQLYYLNKDLPTFAFEISFLREGRETCGWLCSDRLKTDLYLLIWPFAGRGSPKGIRWDEFTKADCLLIRKKALLAMLRQEGLTTERMLHEAARCRADGCRGRVRINGVQGIYYFVSDPQRYREAPINIVVAKSRLLKIAQRRYVVTKDGMTVR